MKPRRFSSLLKEARLKKARGGDPLVRGLAQDSRAVKKGDLFALLPSASGSHRDGSAYAAQAGKRGAVALLTGRRLSAPIPQAVEKDVREAWGRVSACWFGRPSEAMALAAVTGTNGKTTTAYLLYGMMARAAMKPAMIGTVAYRVGGRSYPAPNTTPSALEIQALLAKARKAGATGAVMESSSHALDQARVAGCRFAVGVFTNLTQDHLDYHQTMARYRKAKASLFRRVAASKGQGAWNLDDPAWKSMKAALGKKGWGFSTEKPAADVFAEDIELELGGSRFVLATPSGRFPLRFPLAGRYNISNALAAASAALALGLEPAMVAAALEKPQLPPGRLQRVPGAKGYAVLVDYAHTPDALQRAIAAVREGTPGRVITVFGAGGDRDRGKRPLMARAAVQGSDLVIVTSDNPRTEDPEQILDDVFKGVPRRPGSVQNVLRLADRAQAIQRAVKLARQGDTVLIAGKGHEDYQILGTQKVPFSDLREARQAIRARA